MTPERWKQIEALYHGARALPAADRSAYLATSCPDDQELQREVERLLSQPPSNEGFLAGQARDVATGLVTHHPGLVNRTLGGYEMQALIGVGGMGEVYRARDLKLGREVAIKVLPHAFTSDPGRLARFDREARTLAALNHPNICSIHGFEHAGEIQFLVLELVKGPTLAELIALGNPEAESVSSRLRDSASAAGRGGGAPRRLKIDDALNIARQIARALHFAHEHGIVHRDLKPANVKVTADGAVKVLDFGLAKATAGDAAGADLEPAPNVTHDGTIEGALLGTPAYMSPEQARGKRVDKRTDIWAFGCVLYEMLTGRVAFHGDTLADTIARVIEREPDWSALPRSTPEPIRQLLRACLVKDSQKRLQDIDEVTIDSILSGSVSGTTMPLVRRRRPPRWLWMAAAGLVLAAVAWTWLLRHPSINDLPPPGAARPIVSIALVPFRNASGDATLDSLGSVLTQLLGTALGHSASARIVSVDRVHEVMRDLGIAPNAAVGPLEIARIADFSSARRVVWGSYTKTGESIRIDAVLQDLEQARSEPLVVTAPGDDDLPAAISELAASVRSNVWGAAPGLVKELDATSWRPQTSSFNALRLYYEGKQLILDGSYQEALKKFEEATRQDGRFALAWSAVGLRYATLGDDTQASQAFLRAMNLSEALRPQERFLIWTEHYRGLKNLEKAIESYERLLEVSPNSEALEFELGTLYEQSGKLELAKQHFGKATEFDRKFVGALLALGRVEIRGGNASGSFAHLNEALTVVTQLNNDEVRANILQAIGIQYRDLGRTDEALRSFESSLEVKRRLGNKRSIAGTLSEIAGIHVMQGQPQRAEKSYQDAMALQRQIGDKSGLGNSLVNLAVLFTESLGRPDDALPLLREALRIRRESGDRDAEAWVLNSIGNVFLAKGEFSDAQTYFEQTLEIWEKAKAPGFAIAGVLHSLGETLTKLGRYDEALARYGRALGLRIGDDKRGAAIESYAMGIIFDYQGRYGAAIKSKEEALQALRDLKQRDQWLAEILSGYGHSLSLSGRLDDAIAPLDEAMTLPKALQQHSLIVRQQAERLYYSGQRATVAELAEAASRATDRRWSLADRVAAAKIALTVNPPRTLGATFSALGKEAAGLGQWPLAVECWAGGAATWLKRGDRSAARKEVQRALAKAETLGLRVQLAEAHYLFAEVLRFSADPVASSEYRRALQLLDQIKGEDGNQNILRRADLAFIHAECTRWSK